MRCAWVQDRVLLYLAGELHGWQEKLLLRHLDRCDACTEKAAVLAATQQKAVAALQVDVEAPESLDGRVMSAVRRLPPPRRSWIPEPQWPGLRLGWGAALAALCLLAGGFGAGRWSAARRDGTADNPVALEFRALGETHRVLSASGAPPEVTGLEPSELGRSLSPMVRFPVSAIDLRPEQTRLVGGSSHVVQGAPVACLHYQWEGERVSLFQMDKRRLSLPALRSRSSGAENYVAQRGGGLSYVAWTSAGVEYVLVSRAMPMHRLFQLACHACERQERQRTPPGTEAESS